MKQVDIKEVQAIFAELLAKIESESVVITQEGVPKAILSKYFEEKDSTWSRYGEYMEKIPLGDNFDDDEDISSLF